MPIHNSVYLMYDFETGSRNPYTTQAIQLACVAIEPRNLEIIPNSEFESLIRPEFDEAKCKEFEIDPLEDQALAINGKTREELKKAPQLKVVWKSFTQYCMNYNPTGKKWTTPCLVGFNNIGFDNVILNRMAKEFGPWEEDRQQCTLFNPILKLDLMQMLQPWFESEYNLRTISMDNMRDFLGMSKEGGHDALVDVRQQAEIFIRLMKLTRKYSKITNWRS